MATETRDATPTRGEESARVGRNGLKIRPRARIREWATRRVRCTATRRVVFALVRLLADTRKSPGLESSEVRNSLVFESPQTSRWSCGDMKRSLDFCRISSTLNLPRDSCSLDWHLRNLGAFGLAGKPTGPADLMNFRIRRVMREWNDAALRPASCGGPGNRACPPKRKKATTMGRGRMPRAMATSPRRRPRARPRRPTSCCCSSASPRITTTVLTLARHRSPD